MALHPPVPFLWFNDNAEHAAKYYVEHLGATIAKISRYDAGSPMPEGTAYVVEFDILGTKFLGFNGGPHYTQTPATSFVLDCDTQDDIDRVWDALCDQGQPLQCGWVTDRFGVTWQVVPRKMASWMTTGDKATTDRVIAVMMPMVKLDIAALEAAFEGRTT
jgi:predicted 3-demethylubiquinone-9 3-methyltransferase (glyoxalase superfamily)